MTGAFWDEGKQKWSIQIQKADGTTIEDSADIFVNASGVLKYVAFLPDCCMSMANTVVYSKWKWPAIKGRETFKGKMMHSANWDNSIDLTGKKVGVIGSGSSAVQIVPNIQPSMFFNNPNPIFPQDINLTSLKSSAV